MAYTVLARKYRSLTFGDVVGQDPIAKTLKNAIETGRVAHAYLFCGTRGVGKTTMARILAKALNCLSADKPTTTPCCKCDSCLAINLGEDIDVIEIDGASNNRVDEIRELRENAIYRPARARYKIYIIDEVHMLTTQAFNALLKTLEEPPEHVKFIFATTEPNKVIATIQSRCQRFDFSNISARQIAEQLKSILKQEMVTFEDDLTLALARMANGSMRDGLSLLDRLISTGVQPLTLGLLEDFLGRPSAEKVRQLVERIGESDAAGALAATEALIGTGLGEVQVVDALIEHMRDLLVITSAGADTDLLIMTADEKEKAVELAHRFDAAALIYNITALEKLRWTIKNSDTPRSLLDASLLRFTLAEHFMNVDELLARSQGAPTQVVKKKVPVVDSAPRRAPQATPEAPPQQEAPPVRGSAGDVGPLAESWPQVLAHISNTLGNGTAGLLNDSKPISLEGDLLTISFPATAKLQKQMCETGNRTEQIASAAGECLGKAVRVRFELAAPETKAEAAPVKSTPDKRKILNDPAVKAVILGLDATVTGIEGS